MFLDFPSWAPCTSDCLIHVIRILVTKWFAGHDFFVSRTLFHTRSNRAGRAWKLHRMEGRLAVASHASGRENRRWTNLRRGRSSVRPSSFLRGSKAAALVTDRRHRRQLCGVAPVTSSLLGRPPRLVTAGRTLQRRVKVISRHSGT